MALGIQSRGYLIERGKCSRSPAYRQAGRKNGLVVALFPIELFAREAEINLFNPGLVRKGTRATGRVLIERFE